MPLTTVTLDFGGTLAQERLPRAALYAEVARSEGLPISPEAMAAHMARAACTLKTPAFRYSYPWYEAFIEAIFLQELNLAPARLDPVRTALFERFADPATFELLPGARALLDELTGAGLQLALLSNWSPALPGLLRGLEIEGAFDLVFVSAIEELEKPDPRFFTHALARWNADPATTVHLGNEVENDARPARAAGLAPLLVHCQDPAEFPSVPTLAEAAPRILSRQRR